MTKGKIWVEILLFAVAFWSVFLIIASLAYGEATLAAIFGAAAAFSTITGLWIGGEIK